MKCPFCQQELVRHWGMKEPALYCCDNPKCSRGGVATESAWQELIRTKELLEIECAEHEMCHTQMLKTTEKLERTRKALDVALDAIDKGEAALIGCQEADDKHISDVTAEDGLELMHKAYKQITALEQKGGDNE